MTAGAVEAEFARRVIASRSRRRRALQLVSRSLRHGPTRRRGPVRATASGMEQPRQILVIT